MTERTVLITGAAGGIGGALCEEFHRKGWRVIASDKDRTCDAPHHSYVQLDLARMCNDREYATEQLKCLREEIRSGTLHALINNAATQIIAPFEDLHIDAWRQTLDVNLLAPAQLSRELLTELETARGSVVNVASIHGRLTKSGFSAYATSKAGLIGLTRALAVELGGRVRVNAVCPAAISTSMLVTGFSDTEAELERLGSYHPCGIVGVPEEVATAILYLVESRSSFLTGTILGLDGAIASRLHDPA